MNAKIKLKTIRRSTKLDLQITITKPFTIQKKAGFAVLKDTISTSEVRGQNVGVNGYSPCHGQGRFVIVRADENPVKHKTIMG